MLVSRHLIAYPICSLTVKRKVPLLIALVQAFCGDAHISLEGDLSELRWDGPMEPDPAVATILRRNTVWPLQDFAVLPLESDSTHKIIRDVLPHVGVKRRVAHIQIEKQRSLVFGAFDWFYERHAWVSETVGTSLLDTLVKEGTLVSYEPRPYDAEAR